MNWRKKLDADCLNILDNLLINFSPQKYITTEVKWVAYSILWIQI